MRKSKLDALEKAFSTVGYRYFLNLNLVVEFRLEDNFNSLCSGLCRKCIFELVDANEHFVEI